MRDLSTGMKEGKELAKQGEKGPRGACQLQLGGARACPVGPTMGGDSSTLRILCT